ncbi:uncharacterized protein [Diadema setosum]|uniref:uncharacterized protein n=1 Tax=Diadema setosum TaxID=31175 RepID=UPI003B3B65F1
MPTGNSLDIITEYNSIIDEMSHILQSFNQDTEVVILGDFNVDIFHPAKHHKSQAKALHIFLNEHSLFCLNKPHSIPGTYTYMSDDGMTKSNLDLLIVRTNRMDRYCEFHICPEEPKNTSDHLPVKVLYDNCQDRTGPRKPQDSSSSVPYGRKLPRLKIRWETLDPASTEMLYTRPLEKQCREILSHLPMESEILHPEVAEQVLNEVSNIMLQISTSNLPHSFSSTPKARKPEWTEAVDQTYSQMKHVWKSWKEQGRPRNKECNIWQDYKQAKKRFRRHLRQERQRVKNMILEEVESSREDDPRLFCKLVRQHKVSAKGAETDSIVVHERTYAGHRILAGWEEYFTQLSTPKDLLPCLIDQEVSTAAKTLQRTQMRITTSHLYDAICKLKAGKAGGQDQICPEHIKCAGPIARLVLVQVFNSLVYHCHVPASFKISLILPVHKGKGKPMNDPSNYRGISLTSVFCKLLELLIKPHIEETLRRSNVPDELQSGFQEDHSCMLLASTLNIVIEINSLNKMQTFVAYLDAAKAFDTVWHNGLLLKLFKAGVHGSLWLLVRNLYEGLTAKVWWNGRTSEPFHVRQGVRQGGILSPLLYLVYINGLITKLRDSGLGSSVHSIYTGILVLADDVALVATSADELNSMLQIVYEYSTKWRYTINAAKSAVIVTGPGPQTTHLWQFGSNTIPQVDKHPHLGIIRSNSNHDPSPKMISTANKTLYALTGLGTFRMGLTPTVIASLWERFCLPRMTYGSEVTYLTKAAMNRLDKAQETLFKTLLGLPRSTANESVHILTRLPNVSDKIAILRLRLLGKMITLTPNRVEYRLFKHMLCHHPGSKTTKAFKTLLQQYNLPPLEDVLNMPTTYQQWKRITSAAVLGQREDKSKEAMATKSTLHLLSSLDPSQVSTLLPARLDSHSLRQAVPVKCQLLCGVYPTNTRLTLVGKLQNTRCPCQMPKEETITHLLGECALYAKERKIYISHLPERLRKLLSRTPQDKQATLTASLILTGTSDPNISQEESAILHINSLRFLADMHVIRSSMTS